MLSPIFLPFLSHGSCTIAVQRQISYISFSPFLSFFTFSPTLLWQSLKMFFPFLLLTETTSITAKYLPYLSLIILSFLFHSYSSSDENQNYPLSNLQWFQSYPIYFMLWNFSFTNLDLSIFLSDSFYFTNRNFKLCLLPPTPCSDQSSISEFLSLAVENLKLEKETCFITFQAPANLFFNLLPLSIMDIRNAKNQLPRIVLWGNLHSASYYLYNVRA